MSTFHIYNGQIADFLDCRAVKRELTILEDHLCFEEIYWIWIIVILMSVTFCLFYIIIWTLCIGICHAELPLQ